MFSAGVRISSRDGEQLGVRKKGLYGMVHYEGDGIVRTKKRVLLAEYK